MLAKHYPSLSGDKIDKMAQPSEAYHRPSHRDMDRSGGLQEVAKAGEFDYR